MRSGSHYSSPSPGLAIACALLPARSEEIKVLFDRDDSFRGLCEDLAAAESALLAIDGLPSGIREARRFEYQDLISSLSAEIEEMLSLSKIVRILRNPRT